MPTPPSPASPRPERAAWPAPPAGPVAGPPDDGSGPPTGPGSSTGPDPTADRMLAAARQGSNKAWAALLERVDPRCRALAHLVLGGHDIDDTLLTAYVRAFRARRKGPDDAEVVLLHHVWIACGHEIRRRQRRQAPAPGRRAEVDRRTARLGDDPVGRAVAELRPEERAVWGLTERAGMAPDRVAEALGVDAVVVTTVAERVAARLEALEDDSTGSEDDGDATQAHDLALEADEADDDDDRAEVEADDEVEDLDATDGETDGDALDEPEVAEPEDAGQLDADPPRPGFWPELGRRLRTERDAPRPSPPPALPEPGDPSPSLTPAKAPPVAMQKRAPRKARRRSPDLVEELAGEADRQRPRRRWAATLVKVLAVLVVLGLLGAGIFALYQAASDAESPVRGETVADVARDSMEVLAEAGTWSASVERITLDDAGARQTASLSMVVAEDGSYRVDEPDIGRITTYDARFGVLRDVVTGFPPRDEQGVAPGGPDPTVPRTGMPFDDIAVAARTLTTIDDVAPERTTVNGRSLWRLSGSLADGTRITYLVDPETLVPVRVTWTDGDRTTREVRFRDVVLGAGEPSFTQDLPAGAPPVVDRGFLAVPIGEVRSRTQIDPLVPRYLPTGFVLTGAWVNEADRISSLRYARGPEQIVVTLRPSPVEAGQPWDDPFDREGREVTPEEITLESGPFRDVPTSLVADTADLPSLWAADGELAVTVAGDLSGDELVRVAESLG